MQSSVTRVSSVVVHRPSDTIRGWHFDSTTTNTWLNYGSASHFDNLAPMTAFMWIRRTGAPTLGRVLGKEASGGVGWYCADVQVGGAANSFRTQRATSGTNQSAQTVANIAVTDKLQFVAFCIPAIGTNPQILVGSPYEVAAEPTYSSQVGGTGSNSSDAAGNLAIGNDSSTLASNRGYRGDLYGLALVGRLMTPQDVVEVQYMDPREWADVDQVLVCPDFSEPLLPLDLSGHGEHPTVNSAGTSGARPIALADLGIVRRRNRAFMAPTATSIAVSVTDGSLAGDTFAAMATASASVAEGMVSGDSDAGIAAALSAVADGSIHGETLLALASSVASLTEGTIAGDTWSAIAATLADISEGSIVGDTMDAATAGQQGSVLDGILSGDTFASTVVSLAGLSEGLTIGETLAALANAAAKLTEGLVLGDTWTGVSTLLPVADFTIRMLPRHTVISTGGPSMLTVRLAPRRFTMTAEVH